MARLIITMETIHAGPRRSLPPVPRTAIDAALPLETVASAGALALSLIARDSPVDDAQRFVTALRSAAPEFAAAAGAESAVVREAVPPARHRRARCRVVLRHADGAVTDVTFVGDVGSPSADARAAFALDTARWLAGGQVREDAWLVPDADAHDGAAVDLSAWRAAG
ncbi:hypothetical protein [Blastococcus sp. TF02-09]|uniref:hypothetical protein n=1 Tax=Blastococcus sp. TF02-09 TaxID=2250576 RepID=UPI001F36F648|nr:hypothetical protein [Blastococcus sp. TF02-9]